jgi:hypothetical protein
MPHLIVVRRFECTKDPESYVGCSVATGRAGQRVGARERGLIWSPWLGLCGGLVTYHLNNPLLISSEVEYGIKIFYI